MALDDHVAPTEAELSRQMLLGDGRNRWFDKSFTLIVLPNGMAAVNFEHAWGDGVAVLRYVNEVCANTRRLPRNLQYKCIIQQPLHRPQVWADGNKTPCPSQNVSPATPKELTFNLTPAMQSAVLSAGAGFDNAIKNLEFGMSSAVICIANQDIEALCCPAARMWLRGCAGRFALDQHVALYTQIAPLAELKRCAPMGRKGLKTAGVGPDGACQFAFQLGYYRLYGQTASTYESCSTAAFKHGRTETIRPNTLQVTQATNWCLLSPSSVCVSHCNGRIPPTLQTLAAAKAFLDPNASTEEKLAKFIEANKMHNTLTKNAAMGMGATVQIARQ